MDFLHRHDSPLHPHVEMFGFHFVDDARQGIFTYLVQVGCLGEQGLTFSPHIINTRYMQYNYSVV